MAISRKLRGVVGMALTWGVGFSLLGSLTLLVGLLVGLVPSSIFGPREILAVAVRGFISGAFAGGLFAWLFATAERRQTLATISKLRVAVWGFLGAAVLPLATAIAIGSSVVPLSVLVAGTVVSGVIGSVMAMTTVHLARRAPALPAAEPLGTLGDRPDVLRAE
jgi:hypothetical protein